MFLVISPKDEKSEKKVSEAWRRFQESHHQWNSQPNLPWWSANKCRETARQSDKWNESEFKELPVTVLTEVRDLFMTCLAINNSGSEVIANVTITEFMTRLITEYLQVNTTLLTRMVLQLSGYGNLNKTTDIYLRTVWCQFTAATPQVEQLFFSSNRIPLTTLQVSKSIWRAFQRVEGLWDREDHLPKLAARWKGSSCCLGQA